MKKSTALSTAKWTDPQQILLFHTSSIPYRVNSNDKTDAISFTILGKGIFILVTGNFAAIWQANPKTKNVGFKRNKLIYVQCALMHTKIPNGVL